MKVNIVETKVNFNQLRMMVGSFKLSKNYSDSSFLIMSNDTLKLLESETEISCDASLLFSTNKPHGKSYPVYQDIKIAVCDALKLGEIELK